MAGLWIKWRDCIKCTTRDVGGGIMRGWCTWHAMGLQAKYRNLGSNWPILYPLAGLILVMLILICVRYVNPLFSLSLSLCVCRSNLYAQISCPSDASEPPTERGDSGVRTQRPQQAKKEIFVHGQLSPILSDVAFYSTTIEATTKARHSLQKLPKVCPWVCPWLHKHLGLFLETHFSPQFSEQCLLGSVKTYGRNRIGRP